MQPVLLILAAGVGSRYGGLKQLDRIGPNGETLLDYSIYDAVNSGFGKVVFVIKESLEAGFKEMFINKLRDQVEVDYVFQEIWMIPEGILVADERQKPWGTGHAVLMAGDHIDKPFAVINSDDFYGRKAYEVLANYYKDWTSERENDYCMVGYRVDKTLSEFGSVSRGICQVNGQQELVDVVERTSIEQTPEGIVYKEGNNQAVVISPDSIVSMNCWGFTPSFFGQLKTGFDSFIRENHENYKAEFYIPSVVNKLIQSGQAGVKVLSCDKQWFGMTYQEDRAFVVDSIRKLIHKGIYPQKLWG
ncbi:MAG: NTP transferase domain-containing protein [Bacteroidetes bacterium]|nr:NTP transferase domain-containing protein [Bacteroidota bacterium]